MKFPVLKPANIDGKDYPVGSHFEAPDRDAVKHMINSRILGDAGDGDEVKADAQPDTNLPQPNGIAEQSEE